MSLFSAFLIIVFTNLQRKLTKINHLDIETERAEAVVAADHRAHRVLHPSVVEVALASGQRLHELTHGRPCRRTHPFRLLAVYGDPLLALPDVASVLNRVLVFRHQVLIDRLANSRDSYFVMQILAYCIFRMLHLLSFLAFIFVLVLGMKLISLFRRKTLSIV